MYNAKLYNQANSLQKNSALMYIDEYINIIDWKKDAVIIDIGCGDGSMTSIISKKINCKSVIGCDVSENMVQFANKHYSSECLNFTVMDIEQRLPDHLKGYFHQAFSFYAIQWCHQQETVFQNIYNLLKKDGNCFAALGIHTSLYDAYRVLAKSEKWKSWLTDSEKYVSPYHDSEDPIRDVQQLLGKIGFNVKKMEYKTLIHQYENEEQLRDAIKSVMPYTIPNELADDFITDLIREMYTFDIEKYHLEKSIYDCVFFVKILLIYVEK